MEPSRTLPSRGTNKLLATQEAVYESLYDTRWRLLAMEASRLSPTPTASSSSRESSLDPAPSPQLPLVLSTRAPRQLMLRRPSTQIGFGFTLRHFIVYPPEEELASRRGSLCSAVDTIFVRSVKANSAAFLGGLRVGDRLVRVNDENVANLTYGQVVARVKDAGHVLHLVVVPQEDDMLQRYFSEMARNPESNVKPSYSEEMAESPAMQRMKREVALKEAFLLNEPLTQQRMLPPIPVEAEVHPQPNEVEQKKRQQQQQQMHHVYQSLSDDVDEASDPIRGSARKASSASNPQPLGCSDETSSVSTSRKSSLSRKKNSISSTFFPPRQYAVTLVVNENEKTRLVDMLQRAKSVISRKVDKVMGRKQRTVSSADALTSILQSWVTEEEAKEKQEDNELKMLVHQQKEQLESLKMATGKIIPATIDEDEHDDDEKENDELSLTLKTDDKEATIEGATDDLNIQEVVVEEKNENNKGATEESIVLRIPAKVIKPEVYRRSLTPCESVPRHFSHITESEMYPRMLRRPSSHYDEKAHNASSRPISRQNLNDKGLNESNYNNKGLNDGNYNNETVVLAPSSLPHIQRPESNTVPVGGVWRPQQGDELDPYNRANFQSEFPQPRQQQQLQRQQPLQPQQRPQQRQEHQTAQRERVTWSEERNLRRISYLQATQTEETSRTETIEATDENRDDTDAKRGFKKTQVQSSDRSAASIQRIRALFGERPGNSNNNSNITSNSNNSSSNTGNTVCVEGEDSKQGWLYCKVSAIDGKKAPGRSWKPVFVVLRPKAILIFKDKKSAFEQPGVYEELPVSLAESHVSVADDYTKRKNVFRVVTNNGSEYLFQAEDDVAMHEWVSAIDVSVRVLIDERLSKQRNSSASNSPAAKARKASTGPSIYLKNHGGSPKKTWKGKMAKQLRKIHSSSSPATSSFASENGSLGVSIEDCPMSPLDPGVPWLVSHCVRMVEQRGLEVVGLYRVPGNSASVSMLSELVNSRSPEDAFRVEDEGSKWNDVNVVSSLLKAFFRKLPEPIFTADLYQEFIDAAKIDEVRHRMERLRSLLHLLPSSHFSTLQFLVLHLKSVAAHASVNRMETRNLAIVFGPTLVRPSDNNMMAMVTDMAHQCRIVEALLSHTSFFFDDQSSNFDEDKKGVMEALSEPNLSSNKEEEMATKESLLLTNLQKLEDAGKLVSAKEVVTGVISAANRKMGNDNKANNENNSNVENDQQAMNRRGSSNSGTLRLIQPDRSSPKRYPVQEGSEIDGGILVEEPYSTEAYVKEETLSNFVNLNYLKPSQMAKNGDKKSDSNENENSSSKSLSNKSRDETNNKFDHDEGNESDASECSDILTSITATFDEKLRLLLDPTYQQLTSSSSSSSYPSKNVSSEEESVRNRRRSHGTCELRRGRVVDKHRVPPLLKQGRRSGNTAVVYRDHMKEPKSKCRRQNLRRHTMPNMELNLAAIIEDVRRSAVDSEERRKSSDINDDGNQQANASRVLLETKV